jgi:hypothetical protein
MDETTKLLFFYGWETLSLILTIGLCILLHVYLCVFDIKGGT